MMGNNEFCAGYIKMTYDTPGFNGTLRAESGTCESFLDEVAVRLEAKNGVQNAGEIRQTSVKDMSLEQYKQYIYDKISRIPLHPSQNLNSIAVFISDSGFAAMQKDPQYEKWVMDTLTYDFGFHDPWAGLCGGSYVIHSFGATKEEYHGEGWFKGYQNGRGQTFYEQQSKDSFWERRLRRKKLLKEQMERWQEKKWLEDQRLQKMYEKEMQNRSIRQMQRIRGKDYQSPERRLPVISYSYQTSRLLDQLISSSV